MKIKNILNNAENHIRDGRVDLALDLLSTHFHSTDGVEKSIILLTSRYNSYKKDSLNNTISREQATIELHQINHTCLEIVSEIRKREVAEYSKNTGHDRSTTILFVITFFAAVLGFGGLAGASSTIAIAIFYILFILLVVSLVVNILRKK